MDKRFCLKKSDGNLHLDENHAYFCQVQTHMFVCNVDYADFRMYTFEKDFQGMYSSDGIHIEQIERNLKFWTKRIDFG